MLGRSVEKLSSDVNGLLNYSVLQHDTFYENVSCAHTCTASESLRKSRRRNIMEKLRGYHDSILYTCKTVYNETKNDAHTHNATIIPVLTLVPAATLSPSPF
jgi:hypothetical protein